MWIASERRAPRNDDRTKAPRNDGRARTNNTIKINIFKIHPLIHVFLAKLHVLNHLPIVSPRLKPTIMQTSEFSLKIFLRWTLLIIGFYIFYIVTYLLLVKSMLSQFNWFISNQKMFLSTFKSGDAFWYAMFLLALLFVLYITTLFVNYAPKQKIAALIYGGLVLCTQIFLLVALPADIHLVPHLFINGAFLLVLLLTLWRKPSLI